MSDWKTAVYVTDTHGPLIDKEGRDLLLKFVKDHRPDYRWHGGDVFDFAQIRKGASEEEKEHSLSEDLKAGIEFLNRFEPHVVTWGNHDVRLDDLAEHGSSRAIYDLARMLKAKVEKKVRDLGITDYPYDVRDGWHRYTPTRRIGHGYKSTMYPAKAHHVCFGSTITGHVHSFDHHVPEHIDGGESYTCGSLSQIKQRFNRTHARRLKHRNGFFFIAFNPEQDEQHVWTIRRQERTGKWLDPTEMLEKMRRSRR
jgi:gamma-glutamylcyclotransferase (GGCT)/AIG2-like uncharacterized protein YtfP